MQCIVSEDDRGCAVGSEDGRVHAWHLEAQGGASAGAGTGAGDGDGDADGGAREDDECTEVESRSLAASQADAAPKADVSTSWMAHWGPVVALATVREPEEGGLDHGGLVGRKGWTARLRMSRGGIRRWLTGGHDGDARLWVTPGDAKDMRIASASEAADGREALASGMIQIGGARLVQHLGS